MKAIIIDDELNAIKSLRWEIERFVPEVDLTATFRNAKDAIVYLEENPSPDLVFLDIEMPQMNGFEFIQYFPKRNFDIIFTTAYSEFALKALKSEAVDYLLKPIDSDDLRLAIQKVKKRGKHQEISHELKQTLRELNVGAKKNKIKIEYNGKIDFVEPHEIIYITSEGNYSRIIFENKKEVLLTIKLKELEEELSDKQFFRIHKSYIINVNKITSYIKNQHYIQLNQNINLPLARARKKEFIEKYL